jgi:hypothetical protein
MIRRLAFALVMLSVLGTGASAQQAPRQYLAVNPLGLVFTVISAEYERAITNVASLGVSSSYWDTDDDGLDVQYFSIDAKARYYPSGRALEGFAIGGSVGYTTLRGSFTDDAGRETGRGNAISTGLVLDYNWLLGERNRFLVGTGIGAKRLWLLDIEESDVTVAYPTVRLSVGFAF